MWPFSSLLFTFLLFVVWWALKNVLFQCFWLNNLSNFFAFKVELYFRFFSLCEHNRTCMQQELTLVARPIHLSFDRWSLWKKNRKCNWENKCETWRERGGRGKAMSFGKLLKCTWPIEGMREIRKVINIEFVWETWHMQRDQRWVVIYILNIWKEQT